MTEGARAKGKSEDRREGELAAEGWNAGHKARKKKMLNRLVRRGDRVKVTAEFSKYRGQEGEVLDFTPSRKSVRVQFGHQQATVRVTSVERVGRRASEIEDEVKELRKEIAALKRVLLTYVNQHERRKV